mgnify:CR=1 FL=1
MGIFSMVLSLLSGVALFLFGMSLMGDGLKLVAGNKLEAFLYKMTNTPLESHLVQPLQALSSLPEQRLSWLSVLLTLV